MWRKNTANNAFFNGIIWTTLMIRGDEISSMKTIYHHTKGPVCKPPKPKYFVYG